MRLINCEIAYADPQSGTQILKTVQCEQGTNIKQALLQSDLLAQYQLNLNQLSVGIWHRVLDDLDTVVCEGDRIEIYAPLQIDPKAARRVRAARRKD